MTAIRAICRFFTDGNHGPILLFPDDPERDGRVNSWEPRDGHAAASRDLSRRTRAATADEAQRVKQLYERTYDCEVKLMSRMPSMQKEEVKPTKETGYV